MEPGTARLYHTMAENAMGADEKVMRPERDAAACVLISNVI